MVVVVVVVRGLSTVCREAVNRGTVPFVVLSVLGFEHTNLSFHKAAHSFGLSGQNDYTFVVLPDDNYWLIEDVPVLDDLS